MKTKKPDRIFFILTLVLIVIGFAIFSSAAMGQVGRDASPGFGGGGSVDTGPWPGLVSQRVGEW